MYYKLILINYKITTYIYNVQYERSMLFLKIANDYILLMKLDLKI